MTEVSSGKNDQRMLLHAFVLLQFRHSAVLESVCVTRREAIDLIGNVERISAIDQSINRLLIAVARRLHV